jgi:hypothetical protein
MRFTPKVLSTLARPASACLLIAALGCVPPGNSTSSDAGIAKEQVKAAPAYRPIDVLTSVFEDDFERTPALEDAATGKPGPVILPMPGAREREGGVTSKADSGLILLANDAGAVGYPMTFGKPVDSSGLGPNWRQAQTSAWRVEKGKLCGQGAKNHGVWLSRSLPTNARIEFDAMSDSPEGDLKAEFWGDGQSSATGITYDNATSYLTIFGGWKNSLHVLARINEHGDDRKVITIDKLSDDMKQKPVNRGQSYRFKVERVDGKTVRWFVDGLEMLSYRDDEPLLGQGHDHFGFNDWEARVCFDNVKVTPLP